MPEEADDAVRVLVEIPKGSRNKYEYNQETGALELDRRLYSAVAYPTDYGFLQETRTEEGEELDALVAVTEATFPGCVVVAKPIAMLEMYDGDEPDHKVLCVPMLDPAWNSLESVHDLPGDLANEVRHFFEVYNDLEGKEDRIEGWADRDRASREIESARDRFRSATGEGS